MFGAFLILKTVTNNEIEAFMIALGLSVVSLAIRTSAGGYIFLGAVAAAFLVKIVLNVQFAEGIKVVLAMLILWGSEYLGPFLEAKLKARSAAADAT